MGFEHYLLQSALQESDSVLMSSSGIGVLRNFFFVGSEQH